jgi:uncharacterized cupredoxin-like copper-binding protein
MSRTLKCITVAAALALLGACGTDSASADEVAVKATDTTCVPAKTSFDAGSTTFNVQNDGSKVTEMYVYAKGDRVISEVENIGPGTSRKLTVDLKAGEYELACKPGQTGSGIRKKITVAGEGGTQGGEQAAAEREVEVEALEYRFAGLESFTAKAGETIEFKLENKGTEAHEFEVLGPDGKALGEVEPVPAGKDGEAHITMGAAGAYTYVCDIPGHLDKGMKGSFTVTA